MTAAKKTALKSPKASIAVPQSPLGLFMPKTNKSALGKKGRESVKMTKVSEGSSAINDDFEVQSQQNKVMGQLRGIWQEVHDDQRSVNESIYEARSEEGRRKRRSKKEMK